MSDGILFFCFFVFPKLTTNKIKSYPDMNVLLSLLFLNTLNVILRKKNQTSIHLKMADRHKQLQCNKAAYIHSFSFPRVFAYKCYYRADAKMECMIYTGFILMMWQM